MMFDAKTKEAYRKIKPSDALRERVLTATAKPAPAKVLNLRRIGNLAACFMAVVLIAVLATGLLSDPHRVVLSDGTILGSNGYEIEPATAYYTGATLTLSEGEARMRPDLSAAENCFHFELHSPKIATVTAEEGTILLFDNDLSEYTDCGTLAYFEGECKLWWSVPAMEDGETLVLTVCSDTCTRIELRYLDGKYTAVLVTE